MERGTRGACAKQPPAVTGVAPKIDDLINTLGSVVWVFDWPSGAFTFVNDAAVGLLGFPKADWLTPGFWVDRLHPEDSDWAIAYCVKATSDRLDHDFEYRMMHADGSVRWVRDIVSVDKELGMAGCLRGILVDITLQKQAQQELEHRAEEFAIVFHLLGDLYFRLEPDGTISHFEAPSADRLYAAPEVFLGRQLHDVLPEDVATLAMTGLADFRRTGEASVIEYTLPMTGEDLDYEARLLPLEGGRTAILIRDVTVRNRRERELAESRDSLARLVGMLDSGIAIVQDGTRVFLEMNRPLEVILGYGAGELIGHRPEVVFATPEDSRSFNTHIAGDLLSGRLANAEVILRRKDGTLFDAEVSLRHISDDSRDRLAIVRDISERKAAEVKEHVYQHRLSAMAAELTTTEDRERRQLAEELHDLVCQPLAVARMRLDSSCSMHQLVDVSDLAFVDALLADAIRETRVITTELAPPVLYELGLGSALRWLSDELQRKYGITVHTAVDADETGIGSDGKMVLFRAARELVMNVVKHAETSETWVSLDNLPNWLVLTVEDRGRGFDAGDVVAGTGDSGFGLFSIRERMPHLGGQFEMESAPGRGTMVTLRMPQRA